jgi:hypothetical protein
VQHNVGRQVAAQLGQPDAHLGEGGGVGDGVAEDAGVGAAVVEARDGAEAFLAGWFAWGRGLMGVGFVWGGGGGIGGARSGGRKDVDSPVSQICKRTTVSVSVSTTRLVRKLAPTVEVICEGTKAPWQ